LQWIAIDTQDLAPDPRGELYGAENIRQLLDMRNFMESLRSRGADTGGPPAYNHADRQNFANRSGRFLTRRGSLA